MQIELHQIELRHADLRIRDEGRWRRVLASVAEKGQQVPVIVVAEGERYVLIDGYLRVEAVRRLARDTVGATVWPLSDCEALIEHHHLSSAMRSALEQGWLCARLREQGLGLEELARRLCRSKSWVSRRLGLVGELSATIQQRVRAGTVPPHAAMNYLVPLSRANRRQCEALVEGLGQRRVTDREVGALYEGWRRADRAGTRAPGRRARLFSCARSARRAPRHPLAADAGRAAGEGPDDAQRRGVAGAPTPAQRRHRSGGDVAPPRRERRVARGRERLRVRCARPGGDLDRCWIRPPAWRSSSCMRRDTARAPSRARSASRAARSRRCSPRGRPSVPPLARAEKGRAATATEILELFASCKGNLVRVHEELVAGGARRSRTRR